MAVVNSLAVGKAVGSMGGLTYSTQQGRVIVKQKVSSVRDAMSPEQLIQRDKLNVTVKLWRNFQADLKQFWTRLDKYNSAYNQFVASNIKNANLTFSYDSETQKISQTRFQIARGYFASNILKANPDVATTLITVGTDSNEVIDNLQVGDKIFAYNPDVDYSGIGEIFEQTLTAEDVANMKINALQLSLPDLWLGSKVGIIYQDVMGRNSDAFSDMIQL